jgi:hypothetical protein
MLGMVLKGFKAVHISSLSKEHSLPPAQHTGAHPGRSIDTTLNFLVQQICATWKNKGKVATLLSLDMTGVFDRVVEAR